MSIRWGMGGGIPRGIWWGIGLRGMACPEMKSPRTMHLHLHPHRHPLHTVSTPSPSTNHRKAPSALESADVDPFTHVTVMRLRQGFHQLSSSQALRAGMGAAAHTPTPDPQQPESEAEAV